MDSINERARYNGLNGYDVVYSILVLPYIAMETQKQPQKRFKNLDVPLAKGKRKVLTDALKGKAKIDIVRAHGMSESNVHVALQDEKVIEPIRAAELQRVQRLNKIMEMCTDIIEAPAETPLKYSDKLAAARLVAEISGILGDKGKDININVGLVDLRSADELELRLELARLEDAKRNSTIVDATIVEQPIDIV
jgi:hypothetical protein